MVHILGDAACCGQRVIRRIPSRGTHNRNSRNPSDDGSRTLSSNFQTVNCVRAKKIYAFFLSIYIFFTTAYFGLPAKRLPRLLAPAM